MNTSKLKMTQDLIGTMRILNDICYTNKDGGLIFQSYLNLKLGNKHLNYIMKNNKSGSDFKEEMKVNF